MNVRGTRAKAPVRTRRATRRSVRVVTRRVKPTNGAAATRRAKGRSRQPTRKTKTPAPGIDDGQDTFSRGARQADRQAWRKSERAPRREKGRQGRAGQSTSGR